MALFTSTPKLKRGEKAALLKNREEIDDSMSSGYDSPVYVCDKKQQEERTNRTRKEVEYCSFDDDSDFTSDEETNDVSSDDLDDLENVQEFSADDTMKVTNVQPLIDNIRYILSMPDMCDVMFLVGPQRIPNFGLKSILGTRSNVFFSMFLKQSREEMNTKKKTKKEKNSNVIANHKTTLIIDSYDVEVFQAFLLFVHCGSVIMDATTVVGLLCCAVEFEIPELRTACWEFIDRCLTPSSTTIVIKETLRYGDHNSAQKVRDAVILKQSKTPPKDKNFRSARPEPIGQETLV